ncbi:MAG: hypothetical protein VYC39_17155 [Myxococcota bacterium]|nr:hypothetical protein [Myxococcota bacterium]
MNRPVPVIEVFKNDEQWVAVIDPVSGSADIETVDSLDNWSSSTQTVVINGEAKSVQLFSNGDNYCIRYEEAFV